MRTSSSGRRQDFISACCSSPSSMCSNSRCAARDRSPGCSRRRLSTAKASDGAFSHNSISAKPCSKAASWISAASGSCRCTANPSAKRAARWARRSTRFSPAWAAPCPARRCSTALSWAKSRKNGVMPSITSASVAVSGSERSRSRRSAATWRSSLSVISGSAASVSASEWASTASSLARSPFSARMVVANTGMSRRSKAAAQPATSGGARLMKAACSDRSGALFMAQLLWPESWLHIGCRGGRLERRQPGR